MLLGSKQQKALKGLREIHWRLFLLLAGACFFLIAISFTPYKPEKIPIELIAPYIALGAWIACSVRLAIGRSHFFIILTFLTFSLFLREIHFPGAKTYAYFALVVTAIWVWFWRDRVGEALKDRQLLSWLLLALFTYFVSQFVSRRGLKFIPVERTFHEPLEEGLENFAHLFMIVTCLVGKWKSHQESDKNRSSG